MLGIAWKWQVELFGGVDQELARRLSALETRGPIGAADSGFQTGEVWMAARPAPGTRLVREWRGDRYEVHVIEGGYLWRGRAYGSLSSVASDHGCQPERTEVLRSARQSKGKLMRKRLGCAIYTRKSTEDGLEQDFNSLDAQREACSAYILSQHHEGWREVPELFDDGCFSGGSMERPAFPVTDDSLAFCLSQSQEKPSGPQRCTLTY